MRKVIKTVYIFFTNFVLNNFYETEAVADMARTFMFSPVCF